MTASQPEKKVLLQWPSSVESECLSEAASAVPEGYQGRCIVVLDHGKQICFPNYAEAAKASCLAVNLTIGGYSSAVVMAAEAKQVVMYDTAEAWLFNE